MVALGLLTAAAIFTLPETLPASQRVTSALRPALAGYVSLLSNRIFVGYAAAIGFYYSGLFANIAGAPFAYIDYHNLSPQLYALLFAAMVVGLMIANAINSRLVTRYGTTRMLLTGTIGAALSGTLVALVTGTGWGGIYGLVPTALLFGSMNGFILANAVAGALSTIPTRTGAASALLGAIQYGGGMVGSALVGIFADGTPWPMGTIMAFTGIGSLVSLLVVERRR